MILYQAENSNIDADDSLIITDNRINRAGFARLYDSYFPRLYNYIAYRTNNREETEDVVAQVFERILSRLDTFDARRGSLDSWVFSIARHVLSNRYRSRQRHPEQALSEQEELESGDLPPDQWLKQEELQRLRLYLGRLNERERELVALRFGANLPHRRIAELLNLTEGNVTVSLGRTVRKLRRFFEEDEKFQG